jgi:Bacterial PH domain
VSERATLAFPLAPMSPLIVVLTGIVLAVPGVIALAAVWSGQPALLGVAGAIAGLCAAVWLWARPKRFEVSAGGLAVVWPLRRRFIPRGRIDAVRLVDRGDLRRELGWGARVGVGGLWGQFGWAWTTRRGWVDTYISRLDGFVWVDLREGRPLLITPMNPEGVVRALQQ